MSLSNIHMYNAVLPSYGSGKKQNTATDEQEFISGDDPANIDLINSFGED